jgi:hypothetical protein
MTTPYPFPTPADEFADKRVLVTGGTRGIGAAVVRRFQLAGARVAATARSAPAQAVDGVLFIPADIGTAAGSTSWSATPAAWKPNLVGSNPPTARSSMPRPRRRSPPTAKA